MRTLLTLPPVKPLKSSGFVQFCGPVFNFQKAAQKLEAKVNPDCTLPSILAELQLSQFTSPDVSVFTFTLSSAYRPQLLSKHSSIQKLD